MGEKRTYSPVVHNKEVFDTLVEMGATPVFVEMKCTPEEIEYWEEQIRQFKAGLQRLEECPLPPPRPIVTRNPEIAAIYLEMGKKVILIPSTEET